MHVLIPGGRRVVVPPHGVVVHRATQVPEVDIAAVAPPCTTADRALVDAASWARSDREARTVIAIAFQQRLVSEAGVHAVLTRLVRAKRRRYTARHARIAAGGAQSLGEVDVYSLLQKAGLPLPTQQHERVDADGRRRYLDLYYEEWGLHIEIDGAQHLDARQAWLDAERQNKLWIKGDRLLRFPAWVVFEQPDEVIAQIRDALVAAGWRSDLGMGTTL